MIAHGDSVIYPNFYGTLKFNLQDREFSDSYSSYHIDIVSTCQQPIFWKTQVGFNCAQNKTDSRFLTGSNFTYRDEMVYLVVSTTMGPNSELSMDYMIDELKAWYPDVSISTIKQHIYTNDQLPGVYYPHQVINPFTYGFILAIPINTIKSNGGTVFIGHLGMLIGFKENIDKAKHPLSAKNFVEYLTEKTTEQWSGYHQLGILLIDNSGRSDVYWYNTGFRNKNTGQYVTFPIRSIADQTKLPGFYVTMLDEKGEYHTDFVDIADGPEVLGVYTSRAQAIEFGSPKSKHTADMLDREHDLLKKKIEYANIKLEQEKLAMEAKVKENEYQQERMKLETEIKKDEDALRYAELEAKRIEMENKERANKKKAVSEGLKYVSDIAKALVVLIPIVIGLFKLVKAIPTPKTN